VVVSRNEIKAFIIVGSSVLKWLVSYSKVETNLVDSKKKKGYIGLFRFLKKLH